MIGLLYFILKCSICSCILFTYYLIALKNKQFHQWNRFYLLFTVFIALLIPIIHIPYLEFTSNKISENAPLLNVVQSANNYLEDAGTSYHETINFNQLLFFGYIFISIFLMIPFITSLIKIKSIIKYHTVQNLNHTKFLNTKVPGTPFSFFNYIFWNEDIDITSKCGMQIFQHELVHVKQKHSLDKLFMQTILLFFWSNPFFWIIRRELNVVHEFIADQKSLSNKDVNTFATMILQASQPSKFNIIINPFFHSSIKRRLIMINKNYNTRINYISRILTIPVAMIIFTAFTFKAKPVYNSLIHLDRSITVVIDAGHGAVNGIKTGARVGNIYEDDITLAIANYVKNLNNDKKLKIILSRNTNENVDLHKRVDIANENHADLFISIHVNAAPEANADEKYPDSKFTGIEVDVPKSNNKYQENSIKLGSAIVSELSSVYKINNDLQTKNAGIWVLYKNPCPAVLLECGYITNEKDRQFFTSTFNQKLIAQKLLLSIKQYFNMVKDHSGFSKNKSLESTTTLNPASSKDTSKTDPLLVIDGKLIGKLSRYKTQLNTAAENIRSINVVKGSEAIKKYGKKGKEGIIEITSKDPSIPVLAKKNS